MTRISELLKRLVESGIEVTNEIKKVMINTEIELFSDYDCDPFYSDRPIPFTETEIGEVKTISPIELNRIANIFKRKFHPNWKTV